MCYNALLKEGCCCTKVPACCTESHMDIMRLLDSPLLGRQVDLGKSRWQELFPCTKQSGVADSFEAGFPEEGVGT